MKTIFGVEELGDVQEEIKKMVPFKEGGIRYFHYPRNGEMPMADGLRYLMAKRFGYTQTKHRMITVAIDHDGKIGVSLCSKKDMYNRRLGNIIASNRLRDFMKIQQRDIQKKTGVTWEKIKGDVNESRD